MSEYQYYEWQTIDRPLTSQERSAVNKLSSHITVTSTGAWVDYSWGNFKHEPRQVLARYFDAFLYLANWGSRRLMFRFPSALLDPRALAPYIVEPYIDLMTVGDYLILTFDLAEEEGLDWVEGPGWLANLAPLRNDILRGDYRALYLAWLRAVELDSLEEIAEDEPEPPVPPGLDQLTPALQSLVDLFDVDENLLDAAAQASGEPQGEPGAGLAEGLSRLSRAECEDFLLRLLQGELHLALALRQRLHGQPKVVEIDQGPPRRRVRDLLALQDERAAEAERQQAQAAQRRKLDELEDLARREKEVWRDIERLIETYQAHAYDEATAHLVKLQELAEHRGTQAAFQEQMEDLSQRYRRRPSLMDRFRVHRLAKG
jgi:hypothetical protein